MDEFHRLGPEWQSLFDRIDDALPFVTFEWAIAWWTHLRRRSGALRDALQLFVVRDSDGTAVAIAPMMYTDVRIAGVRVARILQPFGADPNITEVRGMLVAAEREAEAVEALARYVTARDAESWVQWCGIRRQGNAFGRLESVRPATMTRETPTFVITLPASWDEFRKTFPRNLRESLRKCYNSLARDGHDWSFRVIAELTELGPAVNRLIALHGARAARTDTVQHRDCFDDPAARNFLHEVATRLAERRAVRVFQVEIAGEVVATRIGFVFRDRMYLYYSGYDPAWGRYSVMTTVVAEALRYAITGGITGANLSTGPDESKLRWRPTMVEYIDARVVSRHAYARVIHGVLHGSARRTLQRIARRG